jgi:hypothetical protein
MPQRHHPRAALVRGLFGKVRTTAARLWVRLNPTGTILTRFQ